jgi:hypothetical protein
MVEQSTTLPCRRSSRPIAGSRLSMAVIVARYLCQIG